MRKGRFTKQETEKAIASNCLGVEAFFCSILDVIIKGGITFRTNKKTQFKYYSYENISFVDENGLSYPKAEKRITKKVDEVYQILKIKKNKINEPTEKNIFIHLALAFIILLIDIAPNDLKEFVNTENIKDCLKNVDDDLIFLNEEYKYIRKLRKNETVSKKETIRKYIVIYFTALCKCFEDKMKEENSSEENSRTKIIQHIENIFKVICNKSDSPDYENFRLEKLLLDISSYYYNTPEPILVYANDLIYKEEMRLANKCFFLTSKMQIININMPRHNGRTLLLKMLESLIDSLNLDLKYEFDHSVLKESSIGKQDKYYCNFFNILFKLGLIGENNYFCLDPKFKKNFESILKKCIDNYQEQSFFKENSNQILYIPVILELTKENYATLPIEICLKVIHYLYKISVLNGPTYNIALEDIIVLYNRELYLNNDSRNNSKNYIQSQARKRDEILSTILHKYLGFLDITIVAMLDEVYDFNEYDELKLEKELRINAFRGIKLFILKFQDVKGYQVKFTLEDYISLKDHKKSQSANDENELLFFEFKDVDFSENSSVKSQEYEFLKEMGNTKYRSLHSLENYYYGKEIIYNQETIPIITKYEINEFYEDLLDIKKIVADLHNIINTNQKTSFYGGYSIGVLGNFGAGKSSIINLLFSLLCNKNLDETEDVYKEKTYKITLSDYSSESIVEEVYLQLEKSILKEQMELTTCKKKKKLTIFFNHLKFWKWDRKKREVQNEFYYNKLLKGKILENHLISASKIQRIRKSLESFDSFSKKNILKYFCKLEPNLKKDFKKLISTSKEEVKKILKREKKQFNIEQKYYIKEISPRKKEKKTIHLKKKIDSYIFSNHGISSTKEIEDNAELRRKKRKFIIGAVVLGLLSLFSWIIVVVLYCKEINDQSYFKQNLFNFVPLLATIPSLFTSYFIYQGVRSRHTTVLSENKIAVHHIEKLLVFSKELLYKKSKFYKEYKKYDKKLATYPLNTIIMIDNLDRISNERVGNVLQGISFINNEINHSNITFIIPISYEKFYENTLFLNEQYTVKNEEVQFTYKNPDLDMPIVINNAYLNKVFDYKIFLPNLNEEKFEKFIYFALNKAIERRFLTLDSDSIKNLIVFLKRYFEKRQTRNLRDIANVLNNLFTYIPIINKSQLTPQEKYFAILFMLIFCDIRYRFVEAIEELILLNKFIIHLEDRLLSTNELEFYQYYTPFFTTKFKNTFEGKKYEMHFNSIVELLIKEFETKSKNGKAFVLTKEFIEALWEAFKTNISISSATKKIQEKTK